MNPERLREDPHTLTRGATSGSMRAVRRAASTDLDVNTDAGMAMAGSGLAALAA